MGWRPLLFCAFLVVASPVVADPDHYTSYQSLHNFLSVPPTQGGAVSVFRSLSSDPRLNKYLDVNYDINLAASWLVFQSSGEAWSLFPSPASLFPPASENAGPRPSKVVFGVTGYYDSSYDFRLLSLYSDPVVSKLQNPGVEAFWELLRLPESTPEGETVSPGTVLSHVAVGVAHESNGQFLGKAADFEKIKEIDESLYDQAFASMGWNYWFLRGAVTLPIGIPGHQVLATAESRFYVPLWGIEDATDITGTGIREGGIWAYDGIRLGLIYQDLSHALGWGGLSVKAQVILPSVVDRWGRLQYRSLDIPVGLDTMAVAEIGTIPVYAGLALGTGQTPSWYFMNTVTLKLGISFPTMFYLNDLERSN